YHVASGKEFLGLAGLFGPHERRPGRAQILGLAATADPVPLQCAGTNCTAELSAFCLQEEKPVSGKGTAYRLGPAQKSRSSMKRRAVRCGVCL
ncbi:MAG: hypothetical protein QGF09_07970, partial [Rhodospirillales bacterium]|nr:hypothetical protein [Rhodospirillales bacterium]